MGAGPANSLQRLVVSYLGLLNSETEAEYIFAVKRFELLHLEGIQQWSLCVGAGFTHHACSAIATVLRAKYNVDMNCSLQLVAEKHNRKRRHLLDEIDPPCAVATMEDLRDTTVLNAKTGMYEELPPLFND